MYNIQPKNEQVNQHKTLSNCSIVWMHFGVLPSLFYFGVVYGAESVHLYLMAIKRNHSKCID